MRTRFHKLEHSTAGKPAHVIGQDEPCGLRPVIKKSACEGCGDCMEICPNGVIEVRQMTESEISGLGFWSRLHARFHDNKKAVVTNPSACVGCGLCVDQCRHQAISLQAKGI